MVTRYRVRVGGDDRRSPGAHDAVEGGLSGNSALSHCILRMTDRARSLPTAGLQEVGELIVEEALHLIRDVQCMISTVSEERPDHFTVIAGAGSWASAKVGGTWPLAGTLNGRALVTQTPVETDNAAGESATPEVFLTDGVIRAGRLIPILGTEPLPDGRTVLGALGFWRGNGGFDPRERNIIDAFARSATLLLVGSESRRVGAIVSNRLAVANQLSIDLQASFDPTEIVRRLLHTTISAVQADRATLSTIEGDTITIRATVGPSGDENWVGRSYGLDFIESQPHVKTAVTERRPVLSGSLEADAAAPEFRAALTAIQHTLTLPLSVDDQLVGLLVLSRVDDVPFTSADLEMMTLIGHIAALALRNARSYERAEEIGRMKTAFLNMAAHELRTPMTVIQGYVDLMLRGAFGELPRELERPLDVTASKTAELAALVANILQAARAHLPAPRLPFSTFDIREDLTQAVRRAEGRRELLGATLLLEPGPVPVTVIAGREYIGRVLDNLINNALTYTDGSAWVRIGVRMEAHAATIVVADRGLGIPEYARGHVFDQFYRIDEPPWNQVAGTGLGLHLSRQYAELAGGRLTIEPPAMDETTRFALSLPLARSDAGWGGPGDSTTTEPHLVGDL